MQKSRIIRVKVNSSVEFVISAEIIMLFSRQTFSFQKKSSAHEIDFMDNQPTAAVVKLCP